ncbi:TPA: ankyrin repeat domain-containing protein [Klebsiella pneumoniae]
MMNDIETLKKEQTFNLSSAGSASEVSAFINSGAEVNYIMRFTWGEFFPLCKAKNKEVAAAMVKAGADLNLVNSKGQTAIMLNQNAQVVLFLVESGADVQLTDDEGKNVLFYHVQRVMLMAFLVRAGCNPFIKDVYGKSLFEYMTAENRTRFFTELAKFKREIEERKKAVS